MIDERAEVWRLRKGQREARCSVAPHPLGFELRCTVDGEMLRTQVYRDAGSLELDAIAWREAFKTTGWQDA
jgi:hypothetical protein